ncbi:pyridoxal phosphate-dependent aminotransferase [Bradyrhizobium manausense]|uniref:pyridoxal phosphate-dependent aminotransferase n=1 Tax=Bradyrhizobium manausense TaxID=989370 RepID=UPI001BAA9782|nr:pyridoxal phosphate-dependent aminotransferase [Bradyrhizobium manausense]MBR0828640.1 pyridoxal phosphate-dependent aminotransferase [Bradyrhizobium manausense]
MSLTAQRLDRIKASATSAVRAAAAQLASEGRDIMRVSVGEPDFDTPENIRRAAIAAIQAGQTRYTEVSGTLALRRAAARYFHRQHGITYDPDEIIVSTGGKQVIFNALLATVDPGDEVIIPTPCWVSYPEITTLAEGRPVLVPTVREQNFRMSGAQLEAAITSKTKWLILNNPSNPTGAVYDEASLRPLTDVLLRHPNVWILTDDIYEQLTYDGVKAASVAGIEPKLRERTVTMNGCSKGWAMTGWRIGFAGAPSPLIRAMDKLQGQSTTNASSVSQAAAVEALEGPQDHVEVMRCTYQRRRDMVLDVLDGVPGLVCSRPQGAFYVFPSIEGCLGKQSPNGRTIATDEDFVTAILLEEGVALVPGSAFLCPGTFRLSYAAADDILREACARIRRFCEGLR